MAYNTLGSFTWGTAPSIPVTISYDRERLNADMRYRIKIVVSKLGGYSYFGYPIYLGIKLDGSAKVSSYTLKNAYPSQWSNSIVYESAWFTVSGKTTGTTKLSVNLYSGMGSSRDYYYNYDLDVDPCISLLSVSNGTLGESQTLTVTQYNSTFTHTIKYYNGSEWVLVGTEKMTDLTVDWTPPLNLASQNPSGNSVQVRLEIETFSGSVPIGKSSKVVLYAIPESVRPIINTVAFLEYKSGLNSKFRGFVQSKSVLRGMVILQSIDSNYGSEIVSCVTEIEGVKYSGENFRTNTILGSGQIPYTTTVIDSRGRTGTYSGTINVYEYFPPSITTFKATRVNASREEYDEGNIASIRIKFDFASVNSRNDLNYKIYYKKSRDSEFTEATSGQILSYDSTYEIQNISPDYAYEFKLELIDYFETVTASSNVPTGLPIFDVNASGKGFAFGKASEKDCLEIGMDSEIIKTMTFQNGVQIHAQSQDGQSVAVFEPMDSDGNTNVYGNDFQIGITNIDTPELYRPYYRRGDTIRFEAFATAGFVTTSKTALYFTIPLTKPIIGNPTITASGNGFIIRQNGMYTHGSNGSPFVYVQPTRYAITIAPEGLRVYCIFSNTTNAVNNAPAGIFWDGTITLS